LRNLVRPGSAKQVLACLLWSSPAWKMGARDSWIGWTNHKRARNLQLVVNNSRFLILPWVRVRNLASIILSFCARQLPADWERLYGYRPLHLETLVDSCKVRGDLSSMLLMAKEGAQRSDQRLGSYGVELAGLALHEARYIRRSKAGKIHSSVLKVLVEKSIHKRHIGEQCSLRWSYLAFPLPPGSEAAPPRLKNVCRSGDSAEFLAVQVPRVECPPQLALVLHE